MGLGESEGTAQILPAPVAGMGEEEDPSVPAADEVGPKLGQAPQGVAQDEVVRQDQVAHLASAVPVREEREPLLDG